MPGTLHSVNAADVHCNDAGHQVRIFDPIEARLFHHRLQLVLIRVHAASANPLDWRLMRGSPHGIRIMTGLSKPRDPRLGVDVAGRVEAAGGSVTELQAGDEVFGTCSGAFAEYACGPEKSLVRKPDGMTLEQAATVGVAGVTALQGLRDRGRLQRG